VKLLSPCIFRSLCGVPRRLQNFNERKLDEFAVDCQNNKKEKNNANLILSNHFERIQFGQNLNCKWQFFFCFYIMCSILDSIDKKLPEFKSFWDHKYLNYLWPKFIVENVSEFELQPIRRINYYLAIQ
jgi:hypothetical protein